MKAVTTRRHPSCSRRRFAPAASGRAWWLGGLVFLPFMALLFTAPAVAQHVRVHVMADSVAVGERFELALVAEHGFLTEAYFPQEDAAFGDLEVLERRLQTERYGGQERPGVRIDSMVYEVTTFALDSARVPPLSVYFASDEDTTASAQSRAVLIPVRSVVGEDASGLRPVTEPAPFPRPLWPWLLGGLAALGMLVLLGYYLRQRADRDAAVEVQPDAAPSVSPYELALEQLRHLERKYDLSDPSVAKPFYTDLVDLLRRYLTDRLGIPTRERTTRDVLQSLERRSGPGALPPEGTDRLRRVLQQADLAKFADAHPPAATNRRCLNHTRRAIEAFEEAIAPPEEAEESPGTANSSVRA